MDQVGKDKRRWQRVSLNIPVFARGRDENGEEFLEFTTILNVSAGGALLLTRRFLAPASQVSLHLLSASLPEATPEAPYLRSMRVRDARVVWAQLSGAHHLSGLEFLT
jgi:hypothetical protein